jgi:CDP-glycerol glycerophosphotransferase (TagB/SpsB family)
MLVETAVHDTPMIAAVIDTPGGWNARGKYSLALRDIGTWPTHQRFREANAGRIARDDEQLRSRLDEYLSKPELDRAERRKFVQEEITYLDGSAGRRTARFILGLLNRG